MSVSMRKLEYYYAQVKDEPGEAYKFLACLGEARARDRASAPSSGLGSTAEERLVAANRSYPKSAAPSATP